MKTGKRGRFDGSRIGRGASVARVLRSRDRLGAFRSRRCIVKIRPVRLGGKGIGGAKVHLRYIQRDGVTREGEPGQASGAQDFGLVKEMMIAARVDRLALQGELDAVESTNVNRTAPEDC